MGGIVSTGEDNDDLIDNLKAEGYIQTDIVEDVFRAVDRADYYVAEHQDNAYRDSAWKHGHLHLSAPCIYTKVMEYLKLEAGMSFLNLGSGTGYLSSMAGLIIGHYGVNHGIEIYDDVVQYAKERLSQFHTKCRGFDSFEFCEPQFVVGNCLLLASGSRLYDRVYCGTACPPEHENFMKHLIKIGGVLVMPINDQLLQITRVSETVWETKCVLPVSFATLVAPSSEMGFEHVELPPVKVTLLQDACRAMVRRLLCAKIKQEHPELKDRRPPKPKKTRETSRPGEGRISIFPMSMGMMILSHFDDVRERNARDEEDDEEDEMDESDEMDREQTDERNRGESKGKNGTNSDILTDDIDSDDDNGIFCGDDDNNKTDMNTSRLVSVSDCECSNSDDDDVENTDFSYSDNVVSITQTNSNGLRLPGKSRTAYSTSADTETSGLGTLSDHSDDQMSSSLGRSPDSHLTSSSYVGESHTDSWNMDDNKLTRPDDSNRNDRTKDLSRSLDTGRDEFISDASMTFRSKKMRTQSENNDCTESIAESETNDQSGDSNEAAAEPVVKIDYFKEYMIEKVNQLPIPTALKTYVMFDRLL